MNRTEVSAIPAVHRPRFASCAGQGCSGAMRYSAPMTRATWPRRGERKGFRGMFASRRRWWSRREPPPARLRASSSRAHGPACSAANGTRTRSDDPLRVLWNPKKPGPSTSGRRSRTRHRQVARRARLPRVGTMASPLARFPSWRRARRATARRRRKRGWSLDQFPLHPRRLQRLHSSRIGWLGCFRFRPPPNKCRSDSLGSRRFFRRALESRGTFPRPQRRPPNRAQPKRGRCLLGSVARLAPELQPRPVTIGRRRSQGARARRSRSEPRVEGPAVCPEWVTFGGRGRRRSCYRRSVPRAGFASIGLCRERTPR